MPVHRLAANDERTGSHVATTPSSASLAFSTSSPLSRGSARCGLGVRCGRRGRVRVGKISYTSFPRVAEAVLIRGDVVIVMGRETVVPKAPTPNAGKTVQRRYTNIWMKRDGEWHLGARHANVILSN